MAERKPIIVEITNMTLLMVQETFSSIEGIIVEKDHRVYAIIGWVYEESWMEEYW